MSTSQIPNDTLSDVRRLVDLAEERTNRRSSERQPFFHPVLLNIEGSEESHFAFTRDISQGGIGLVHSVPLLPQRMSVISFLEKEGERIDVPIELLWCSQCGKEWYISGGRFLTESEL